MKDAAIAAIRTSVESLEDLLGEVSSSGMWTQAKFSPRDQLMYYVRRLCFKVALADEEMHRAEIAAIRSLYPDWMESADIVEELKEWIDDGSVVWSVCPESFRILAALDVREGIKRRSVSLLRELNCIGLNLASADAERTEEEVEVLTEAIITVGQMLTDGGFALEATTEIIKEAFLPRQDEEGEAAAPVGSGVVRGVAPTLRQVIDELNSLVGLAHVKQEVATLSNIVRVRELRRERGMAVPPLSLHMVFSGNPGTGKTTVARLLAAILESLGVLTTGHLVEVDRSGLVAGYVGQTAIKVREKVSEALGGILFIDEAYSLARSGDGSDSYGQEAIDTLIKCMEDHRDDLVVIVAGYTREMDKFLESNPGVRSRFNRHLHFQDYTSEELAEIFETICHRSGYALGDGLRRVVTKYFVQLEASGEHFARFGNARGVRNLFELTVASHANRLALDDEITDRDLVTLLPKDTLGWPAVGLTGL